VTDFEDSQRVVGVIQDPATTSTGSLTSRLDLLVRLLLRLFPKLFPRPEEGRKGTTRASWIAVRKLQRIHQRL
jgi:hypothetical protein